MITCVCMEKSGVMGEILALKPEQYVEPEKGGGVFEVLDPRMNDFEKAAFTVMRRYQAALKDNIKLIESNEPKGKEKSALKTEANILYAKATMVLNLMYFSIRDRLNLWSTPLSVSEGFKIIIPDEEELNAEKSLAIAIPVGKVLADAIKDIISKTTKDPGGDEFDRMLLEAGSDGKTH